MILNPDNLVVIRGKPIRSDFSKYYKVLDNGSTYLRLELKVFNPSKAQKYQDRLLSYDIICVQVFGHVKDEKHPKGELAERLLTKISKNVYVTCYCHVIVKSQLFKGRKHTNMFLTLDGFKTEDSDIVVQASQKQKAERKQMLKQQNQ